MELAPQLVEMLAALVRGPRETGKVVTLDGKSVGAPRAAGPFLLAPGLPAKPNDNEAQALYRRTLEAMRRALKRAGLPTHHGLHALRHTYGSGLVSRGASLAFVQQQMGHKGISQTVDTYGSWLPVQQPGAVQGFADELLGARGHQVDTTEAAAAVNSSGASELPERCHVLDVLVARAGVEDHDRVLG